MGEVREESQMREDSDGLYPSNQENSVVKLLEKTHKDY